METCVDCGKAFDPEDLYEVEGGVRCETCAMKAGLYPLGHTGLRRDKISEKGRLITPPEPLAYKPGNH